MSISLGYRANVGICLFNSKGLVFVGERIDKPDLADSWQMPQGGIDPEEDIVQAATRELKEETGISKTELIRIHPVPLIYDFPVGFAHPIARSYRGQSQTWVALRFTGDESDIDLNGDEHPEFSRYKWVDLEHIVDMAIYFKRDVYRQVAKAFADIPPTFL